MKNLFAALMMLCIGAGLLPQALRAVTPEELEQARTYAAIVYLRNANPKSDYLDQVSASSRKELEGKLKETEKGNLQKFNKSLPSTKGYESWGMDELVTFSTDAVKAPGGYTSTGYAANMVRKKVQGMKLTPPKPNPAPTPAPAAEQPAAQQPVEETPQPEEPQPQQEEPVVTETNLPDPFAQTQEEVVTDSSSLMIAEDSLLNNAQQESAGAENSSNNSMYIIILCVLVIAVIILIIYAARYFNRQNEPQKESSRRRVTDDENDDDRREVMEETRRDVAPWRTTTLRPERRQQQDEGRNDISAEALRQRDLTIESLRTENQELRQVVDEYKYQVNYLKSEKERLEMECNRARMTSQQSQDFNMGTNTLNDRYADRHQTTVRSTTKAEPQQRGRVIYLGRSNSEGMFVRAERELNPQHSVFRLSTLDNVTGTFTIVEDQTVESRVLANPDQLLAVSCDIISADTYGKETIITDQPGTAIFENGRWRVLRPARINFV